MSSETDYPSPAPSAQARKKGVTGAVMGLPIVPGIDKKTSDESMPETRSAAITTKGISLKAAHRSFDKKSDAAEDESTNRDDLRLQADARSNTATETNWFLKDQDLRPVPLYYPLEKTHRRVTGENASAIVSRISDSCRQMSVQAEYNHKGVMGTALFTTGEHVELFVCLWKGTPDRFESDCIIVELQRRNGCAVTFHKYARNILNAAQGDFDSGEYEVEELQQRKQSVSVMEQLLQRKPSGKSAAGNSEHVTALLALEIAASLLKKDRMDARQLGMESLCLLTDAARTSMLTAKISSDVVLFGSVQSDAQDEDTVLEELGVREAVLSLIQLGRLGDEAMDLDSDDDVIYPEDKKHDDMLHNLALTVLSNALEVYERSLLESAGPPSADADKFLEEAQEISNRDILKSLLNVLDNASSKPHDATLSAQCLRSLFQSSRKARKDARGYNAKNIVRTAIELGTKSHAKLKTQSEKVLQVLTKYQDQDAE